jgi:hypothetical protein
MISPLSLGPNSKSSKKPAEAAATTSTGFLLDLLFDPEGGGDNLFKLHGITTHKTILSMRI